MAAVLAFALFMAAQASGPVPEKPKPMPTIEAMVSSIDACTGKAQGPKKMRDIWTAAGWKPTATAMASSTMMMTFYTRNDVELTYFHSSQMKQCITSSIISPDFDVEKLVAAVTKKMAKAPKIDAPGERYYYYYKGSKILNLLVKNDQRGRYVELSVVS
jgi:hypothetical protein